MDSLRFGFLIGACALPAVLLCVLIYWKYKP